MSYHFNWCLVDEATHEMFIPDDDMALVLPHIQLDVSPVQIIAVKIALPKNEVVAVYYKVKLRLIQEMQRICLKKLHLK